MPHTIGQQYKQSLGILLFGIVLLLLMLGTLFAYTAQAGTSGNLSLTVHDTNLTSANGTKYVRLQWEVFDTLNCRLNHGIGTLVDDELPRGSRLVTPPRKDETNYILQCGAKQATVQVSTE